MTVAATEIVVRVIAPIRLGGRLGGTGYITVLLDEACAKKIYTVKLDIRCDETVIRMEVNPKSSPEACPLFALGLPNGMG